MMSAEEEARRDAWWGAGHRDTDNWPAGWPAGADRDAAVKARAEFEQTHPATTEPEPEATPLVEKFRRLLHE
ncbi:MAG: hypothetical protein RBS72_14995 [Sedimentisphaerales bacterium]|jgi:hypothetical protein|nr:hypothetical protein [Sedimentisphaerales bacterium]NLX22550.1 hypothetical protein [Phycisphaerae bacterium]HNY80779.1 hypothetical protein [Sedimentisphaerales bacterium]HOC62291.1 hypothetical protein [Sedimentisphaerales bacterium]HOH66628.1 hypothetical protein [Sedimentisphaerales bacterium]